MDILFAANTVKNCLHFLLNSKMKNRKASLNGEYCLSFIPIGQVMTEPYDLFKERPPLTTTTTTRLNDSRDWGPVPGPKLSSQVLLT